MKRRSFYKERINTPFIVGIEEMIMLKTIGRLNIVFTYGKVREQRLIQVIQVQGISIISQWVSRNCCLYVKEKMIISLEKRPRILLSDWLIMSVIRILNL